MYLEVIIFSASFSVVIHLLYPMLNLLIAMLVLSVIMITVGNNYKKSMLIRFLSEDPKNSSFLLTYVVIVTRLINDYDEEKELYL